MQGWYLRLSCRPIVQKPTSASPCPPAPLPRCREPLTDIILLLAFHCFYIYTYLVNFNIYYSRRGKGKDHPRTGHEGPEGEYSYSCTLSLTSALDGGGWSTPRPGRFTPGKETRYPLYRRLGRPQGRSGRVRKISLTPGFDPRTVQPVSSRYTD